VRGVTRDGFFGDSTCQARQSAAKENEPSCE
jgi:hypothetical protein